MSAVELYVRDKQGKLIKDVCNTSVINGLRGYNSIGCK